MPRSITISALRRRLSALLEPANPTTPGEATPRHPNASPPAPSSPSASDAPPLSLRYRLPGEAASDGLVCLQSDDDWNLLVEEYDSLQALSASSGSPPSRLHVYATPFPRAGGGATWRLQLAHRAAELCLSEYLTLLRSLAAS